VRNERSEGSRRSCSEAKGPESLPRLPSTVGSPCNVWASDYHVLKE